MEKINLADKFSLFDDTWSPRIVDDFDVKLVKLRGAFVWHKHDAQDELFLVIKGRLTLKLHDCDVALEEGELFVVPHGVEHMPVAEDEAQVLLFERKGTLNTGDADDPRAVAAPQWI